MDRSIKSEADIPKPEANPTTVTTSGVDTASIREQMTSLEAELATLKTHFTYKQHNLPVPSYYHKNWWNNYYIHGLALMAGVDSAGTFFLIDSYNCSGPRWPDEEELEILKKGILGMEGCDSARSRLELRMKDTTIVQRMRPSLPGQLWPQRKPPIKHGSWIGTGSFCTDYYPLPDNPALVHILADSAVGYFKFYRYCDGHGRGDLGYAQKRDRTGIRECARLSEIITALAALRKQLGGDAM